MIEKELAEMVTLAQLAKLLPSRPHISTVARWASRGIRGVRLTTQLICGRRCATFREVERFIAASSAAAAKPTSAAAVTSSRPRSTRVKRADRRLDNHGV